jgi:hypothetical protein
MNKITILVSTQKHMYTYTHIKIQNALFCIVANDIYHRIYSNPLRHNRWVKLLEIFHMIVGCYEPSWFKIKDFYPLNWLFNSYYIYSAPRNVVATFTQSVTRWHFRKAKFVQSCNIQFLNFFKRIC